MRADITPMINTSIKNNHIAIENLFKSIFSEVPNTTIDLKDSSIHISHNDKNNTDAASIDLIQTEEGFSITYWDGYSLAENENEKDLKKSLMIFKRYSKKMAKNLIRFGS